MLLQGCSVLYIRNLLVLISIMITIFKKEVKQGVILSEIKSTYEILEQREAEVERIVLLQKKKRFSKYIVARISKLHPSATIEESNDFINFTPKSLGHPITIYPIWRENIENIRVEIAEDIELAIERLRAKLHNKIYLIYPKSRYLTKHIEIKSVDIDSNSELKIVPYKISCKFKKELEAISF